MSRNIWEKSKDRFPSILKLLFLIIQWHSFKNRSYHHSQSYTFTSTFTLTSLQKFPSLLLPIWTSIHPLSIYLCVCWKPKDPDTMPLGVTYGREGQVTKLRQVLVSAVVRTFQVSMGSPHPTTRKASLSHPDGKINEGIGLKCLFIQRSWAQGKRWERERKALTGQVGSLWVLPCVWEGKSHWDCRMVIAFLLTWTSTSCVPQRAASWHKSLSWPGQALKTSTWDCHVLWCLPGTKNHPLHLTATPDTPRR